MSRIAAGGREAIVATMDQQSLEEAIADFCPAIKFLPETDSTNRVALEWAKSGAPEGAIVVADYQTAGRGRFDRTWFAPPGECLLFSVVLRPVCKLEEAPLVNLAAAVALADAIAGEGLQAKVKWPNDVRINGRKTAGILAEALPGRGLPPENPGAGRSPEDGRLCVVLGVGVNVNVTRFPPALGASATSLALEAGRGIERVGLLRRFLGHLGALYEAFPAGVVQAYLSRSDVLGRNVRIQVPNGAVEGTAVGIDPLGNLVLGSGEKVSVGDVAYVEGGEA